MIASSSIGAVYKGTLSSGVEIAVASIPVAAVKDWSNNLETQFRNKVDWKLTPPHYLVSNLVPHSLNVSLQLFQIDSLSKVNHKNFVNLLGYCEEDEPFTRMLVFEYAPNGTLFEHLQSEYL